MTSNQFRCSKCNKSYSSQSALCKHKKNVHFGEQASEVESFKEGSVKCGICGIGAQTLKHLCLHLNSCHNHNVCIKKISFESRVQYEKWKSDVEEVGKFKFVSKRPAEKCKQWTIQHLYCFRSGYFSSVSKGKRGPRAMLTNKINFYCSAFAIVKAFTEGKIDVETCLDHYSHDDEICRLPLSNDVQIQIAALLNDDRNVDYVLDNFRKDISCDETNQVVLKRHNLIKRDDILNTQSRFGLNVAQKSPLDGTSVELWYKESISSDGEETTLFCYENDEKNYCIGLQTEFQRQMLKQFGNNVICVDSTHGTNRYDCLLLTVLVLDEFQKGLPVAFFLAKTEDQVKLSLFFNRLKNRVGPLKPKFFMSDDAPALFNAWSDVFGSTETQKLLCTWHVLKNWKANIKTKLLVVPVVAAGQKEPEPDEKIQKAINDSLRVLIKEQDEAIFFRLLHVFLLELH